MQEVLLNMNDFHFMREQSTHCWWVKQLLLIILIPLDHMSVTAQRAYEDTVAVQDGTITTGEEYNNYITKGYKAQVVEQSTVFAQLTLISGDPKFMRWH